MSRNILSQSWIDPSSRATGPFTDTLKDVVAIDDAWGLLAFSLIVVVVGMLNGHAGAGALADAAREIGDGVALGAAIGLPAAYLTGRLSKANPCRPRRWASCF